MINTIKYYYFLILFTIQDFLFGKEIEVPSETQDDPYAGGQCFYDPTTGKKSCE